MARDFDFKPKSNHSKPNLAPQFSRQAIERPNPKRKAKWSLILLVIGLIILGFALYRQYNQTNPNSAPQQSVTTQQNLQDITVSIYSSDLSLSSCRDLANRITDLGYRATCIGQSLGVHQSTEIWAVSSAKEQAQKINQQEGLKANIFELASESQSQVIIYLEKS